MAKVDLSQALVPSVLDRLMDPDSSGTVARRGYSIEQIVNAVRRDLEEILNTRRGVTEIPAEFPELKVSPINFGLPDFGSIATSTRAQHEDVGRLMEEAVERFEPRLRNVRVALIETSDGKDTTLRFQIEARLRMDPYPDVSFETVLELTTGCTSITAAKSG